MSKAAGDRIVGPANEKVDLVRDVEQLIVDILHKGAVTLDNTASALGMTGKTLERRLAARDKTFAGLTNAIQAHPDVNLLISPSDSEDAIIEQVLKSAGKWHKTGEEGHVLFSGFDGDQNGYNLLSAKYMDVNGVQNLFFEVDLAYGAFKDIWAGKQPQQMLIDPGFAISQATLEAKREDMWGYHVWKEKNK